MTAAVLAYVFNWGPVLDRWDEFLLGAWVDVWVTGLSFALACCLGLGIAVLRLSGTALLRWPAFAYVQLIRGVPLLVFLYWVYFGIAIVVGLSFSPIEAAIIVLSLTGSAYTAEIFRGGLQAIDRGQVEASRSLGLGRIATYRHVLLPQTIRIVIPPLGNTFVGLLKGATLMSIIAVQDMVLVATNVNINYFTPFEAFTAIAVILVALVAVFSASVSVLERTLRLP
ncbi:MAG: amino acid ABC transporter permease [Actinobacteria bacterium]|nr:amino acid ABC transporter permease [Actinomycetota bacterium]